MTRLSSQRLAFPEGCDIVMPLFRLQWSTRAVVEGVCSRYQPRTLYLITPASTKTQLERTAGDQQWRANALVVVEEESFFVAAFNLSKSRLARMLDVAKSLYKPGWFFQQLLKLGADDGLPGVSPRYLVWDADLLPVAAWPALAGDGRLTYALLQSRRRGNEQIVAAWEAWIREVLGVTPLTDPAGEATFVPHHMWFVRDHLRTLRRRLAEYFSESQTPWPELMMRSAARFGTFSEYWLYASWAAAEHPETAPRPLPYQAYGATTERFFEDGTAPFATAARRFLGAAASEPFQPSYEELMAFLVADYEAAGQPLPSSLSFEASVRHRLKGAANMHVEELRSRWHTIGEEGEARA